MKLCIAMNAIVSSKVPFTNALIVLIMICVRNAIPAKQSIRIIMGVNTLLLRRKREKKPVFVLGVLQMLPAIVCCYDINSAMRMYSMQQILNLSYLIKSNESYVKFMLIH
jgi:hypothetical protein